MREHHVEHHKQGNVEQDRHNKTDTVPNRNYPVGQPGAEVGKHAAGKRSQEENRANESQDK